MGRPCSNLAAAIHLFAEPGGSSRCIGFNAHDLGAIWTGGRQAGGLGFDFDTNTAYLWINGQYLSLNFPGATITRLRGITSGGAVHGSVQLNGVYRLFIWRAGQFSLMPSDWTYIQTMTDGGLLLVYRDTGQKAPSGDAVLVVEIRSLSGDVLGLSHGQCLNLTSGAQACGTIVDMNNQGQLLVNQGYMPGAAPNSTGHVVLTPAP